MEKLKALLEVASKLYLKIVAENMAQEKQEARGQRKRKRNNPNDASGEKKKNLKPSSPAPLPRPAEPPQWVVDAVRRKRGTSLAYWVGKVLWKTDVDTDQSRLQLGSKFADNSGVFEKLRKDETRRVENTMGIPVRGLDSMGRDYKMEFKREKCLNAYRFIKEWNQFHIANGLALNDIVHLWSFRVKQGGIEEGSNADEEDNRDDNGDLWMAIDYTKV